MLILVNIKQVSVLKLVPTYFFSGVVDGLSIGTNPNSLKAKISDLKIPPLNYDPNSSRWKQHAELIGVVESW